ncbi:MAG: hypothetical protein J6P29_03640 [Acetobacter sp.]|nr:hypothetical protein [Acetobacter sp.]
MDNTNKQLIGVLNYTIQREQSAALHRLAMRKMAEGYSSQMLAEETRSGLKELVANNNPQCINAV